MAAIKPTKKATTPTTMPPMAFGGSFNFSYADLEPGFEDDRCGWSEELAGSEDVGE